MNKNLEEFFDLPAMNEVNDTPEESSTEVVEYTDEKMHELIEQADKIDAALPQVGGLEQVDADYDNYAKKAMDTFDDLVDLGKNVEDRHAADIFNAASSMMSNALNAKTNKAQKKLDMVKLQLQKARLEHEQEKLAYMKQKNLGKGDESAEPTEGKIIGTRSDLINDILSGMKKENE